MNEHQFSDPQLKSIEEQLASFPPPVSSLEKDRILYTCAFEAGQKSASRSLAYWRAGVASLSLLLMLALIPHFYPFPSVCNQVSEDHPPAVPGPPSKSIPGSPSPSLSRPLVADLDAWQVQASGSGSLSEQLAEFSRSDPHLRSHAVSALTRNLTSP